MNGNVRLLFQSFFQCGNRLFMLCFDGKYPFFGIGDFHAVMNAPHSLLRHGLQLAHIVTQQGFALGGIHQNISALQICAQFYSGGKACTSHTHQSGSLNSSKLAVILRQDGLKPLTLCIGRLDDHGIVRNTRHRSVIGAVDGSAQSGRYRQQCSPFQDVAFLHHSLAGSADVLLQKNGFQ